MPTTQGRATRQSDGLSQYAYVQNNPTLWRDPSGMIPEALGNALGKQIADCVQEILKQYFPNFDFNRLRLHKDKSLPWFGVAAITHGNHIYYDADSINGSVQGIATLGHEIVHSIQYARSGSASFYYNYVHSYISNRLRGDSDKTAYERIPQETDALKKENEILQDLFNKYGLFAEPCKKVCK